MNNKSYGNTINIEKFRADLNGECKERFGNNLSEFARALGYSAGAIGNVARGRDMPSKRMVVATCMLMGYSLDRYKKEVVEVKPEETIAVDNTVGVEKLLNTLIEQNNAIIECLSTLIEEFR